MLYQGIWQHQQITSGTEYDFLDWIHPHGLK
ncbi:MAG: hypothetical protein CM15mV7_0700 [uncultured marine virus]|jgi:hypothetical protein|nr:MAG: hypothetical protein CM15mV7_0700 [uncultured marine virus]